MKLFLRVKNIMIYINKKYLNLVLKVGIFIVYCLLNCVIILKKKERTVSCKRYMRFHRKITNFLSYKIDSIEINFYALLL